MKSIFSFLLLASFVIQAKAQKLKTKDVPQPVLNAFKDSFPNVKKAYWGKDSIHYHVGFFYLKAPGSVTYDITGKRIISEMQLPVEDLPQSIVEYVQKKYPGEIVKEAAQIITGEGTVTYEVEINDLDLIFDAKGNFIKSFKCYD